MPEGVRGHMVILFFRYFSKQKTEDGGTFARLFRKLLFCFTFNTQMPEDAAGEYMPIFIYLFNYYLFLLLKQMPKDGGIYMLSRTLPYRPR